MKIEGGVWEKKFGRISSGSQLSFDQISGNVVNWKVINP